jgi:protoheme ferro-lyase
MVMNVMGHIDVRTAMRYQHPVLDSVREAIDQRNLRHKPRHRELRVQ